MLVDAGLAAESPLPAAVRAIRRLRPARIVAAVPVATAPGSDEVDVGADEVVCLLMPQDDSPVGVWYEDFPAVSADEVRELLQTAASDESVYNYSPSGRGSAW